MNNYEWRQHKRDQDSWYTRDEVETITDAYKHLFGHVELELREYWNLDREKRRPWGCLTTDFHNATFEQYEEASRCALDIERKICQIRKEPDGEARKRALWKEGEALRDITGIGVGLSLGVCPWTDLGLLQTYEQNKHRNRLTIILAHDWYPIVPDKPHPVDVPLLRRDEGLLGKYKWAVPRAINNNSEMWLFLNFKPDFRPPNTKVTGSFKPDGLSAKACTEGFGAIVKAVSRRFKDVQVISWGVPVWESLRKQIEEADECKSLGVKANATQNPGHLYNLRYGDQIVKYLPLAHPCYASNFNKEHADRGYANMGLAG